MSKINVCLLHRKPPVYFEREFALAQMPVPLTLRMTKNDALLSYKAQDEAQEQIKKYVEEGYPFPPFGQGSEQIEITPTLIYAVAPVFVLQAPVAAGDRYSFDELIWISATEPAAWNRIQEFLWEVNGEKEEPAEGLLGNASGVTPPSP